MFRLRVLAFLFRHPAGAASGDAQVGSRSTAGRSLARGYARTRTLIALSCVGLLAFAPLLHAQSKTGTTSLLLTVGQQEQLQFQGENVILKIRLASGVTARLWGDAACATPIRKAIVLTKSGTYTISLDDVPQNNKGYVCLLTSDGILRDSVVWPETGATTAETSAVSKP